MPRVCAFVPFACLVITTSAAVSQCASTWLPGQAIPGPSGLVRALASVANGDLIVGGSFLYAGNVPARSIARWNGAQWSPLGSGVQGVVEAVVQMPNGDLIVGGTFATAGGLPLANIARWNGTSWSGVGGGVDGTVQALVVLPTGDVVAGGVFANAGGQPIQSIARFDGTSWSALGGGVVGGVEALTRMPNGDLVFGGVGLAAAGAPPVGLPGLLRWNGSTWSTIGSAGGFCHGLATAPNGDLLAVGSLTAPGMNGTVLRWDGSAWSLLVPSPSVQPAAVAALANGDIVVAGSFLAFAGVAANNIARFDGTSWSGLGSGRRWQVETLLPTANGGLLAGGGSGFGAFANSESLGLWNGSAWSEVGGDRAPEVIALGKQANGDVVIGGGFDRIGGVVAANVARWNGLGWSPIGNGVDGRVTAIGTAGNGDLLVGGAFGVVGASVTDFVRRYDGVSWSGMSAGLTGVPRSFAMLQGQVVAGGYEVTGFGESVARWTGTTWQGLGLGGNVLQLLELANGSLLAVGSFLPGGCAAVLQGGVWSPYGGGLGSGAYPAAESAVRLRDGSVVVGGRLGGANNVQRFDGTAWTVLGSIGGGDVHSLLVLPDGDLLAIGEFTVADGAAVSGVARWDGSSWTSYGIGTTGPAKCSTLARSGELFLGGAFVAAGGQPSASWAHAVPTCAASVMAVGSGCLGTTGPVALAPLDLAWLGGELHARGFGLPSNGLALAAVGLQPASLPLAQLLPQAGAGCMLLVQPLLVDAAIPVAGVVDVAVRVPDNVALLGVSLLQQAFGLDGLAAGITQVTSSNALAWTIGDL